MTHRRVTLLPTVLTLVVAVAALVGCGSKGIDGSGTTARLADHAWAVGAHGTILATSDGGAHWRAQDSGTTHEIGSVAFADTEHGWALANHARIDGVASAILATDDGGKTWSRSESLTTRYGLADVACADRDHVWVVGQSSEGDALILASTDGGATWVRQRVDLADEIVSVVAASDTSHVWASSFQPDPQGYDSRILQSADGGAHWQVGQDIPLAIVGMTPASATACWVAGIPYKQNPSSLALGDAGSVSWKQAPEHAWALEGIVRLDASQIGLFGSGDVSEGFWAGTGQDADWTRAVFPDAVTPRAVAFADATHGWAVGWSDRSGSEDVILATSDGGATWARSYGDAQTPQLTDIACPSQQ
jgi:photosystem II stability/assembly factor-like uncharacterized protein